jgi:hypothetical protein
VLVHFGDLVIQVADILFKDEAGVFNGFYGFAKKRPNSPLKPFPQRHE